MASADAPAPASPAVAVEEWEEELAGRGVRFMLVRMQRSALVWVGEAGVPQPMLGTLTAAMMTRYDDFPATATVMGPPSDVGSSMASHLSRRFNAQVLLASPLPESFEDLAPEMERSIMLKLREHEAWRHPPATASG